MKKPETPFRLFVLFFLRYERDRYNRGYEKIQRIQRISIEKPLRIENFTLQEVWEMLGKFFSAFMFILF